MHFSGPVQTARPRPRPRPQQFLSSEPILVGEPVAFAIGNLSFITTDESAAKSSLAQGSIGSVWMRDPQTGQWLRGWFRDGKKILFGRPGTNRGIVFNLDQLPQAGNGLRNFTAQGVFPNSEPPQGTPKTFDEAANAVSDPTAKDSQVVESTTEGPPATEKKGTTLDLLYRSQSSANSHKSTTQPTEVKPEEKTEPKNNGAWKSYSPLSTPEKKSPK